MTLPITIFTEEGNFDTNLSGIEYFTLSGKDGEKYLAISGPGMKDGIARICRPMFKDSWREIYRGRDLSAHEVKDEWLKNRQVWKLGMRGY